MKNKLAKRMASIVLAVVMVCSALPFTPIVASADTTPELLAQYFTTSDYTYDAVSNQTGALTLGGGTITASADGTATFNSAYLSINNTGIFSDVSAFDGMTLSFNVTMSNSNCWGMAFYSFGSDTTTSNSFFTAPYIGYSGAEWSGNGSKFSTGEFMNTGYVTSNGTEEVKAYPKNSVTKALNTNYNIVLSVTRDDITYYINGVKYIAGYGANAYLLETMLNEIKNFGENYIGKSRWNDPYYSGTMRDFRIYNGAMTDEQIHDEFSGYTVGSDWNLVSSTDFENAAWTDNKADGINFTSTDGSNNYMQWYGEEYSKKHVDIDNDGNGAKIDDGYIFMDGYTEDGSTFTSSGTPITGADKFLLDMQFRFTDNFNANNSKYSLINILTNGYYDSHLTKDSGPNISQNVFFNQLGSGQINIEGQLAAVSGSSANTCSTENSKLTANTAYHYIIEYKEQVLKAYITDAYGNRLVDYGTIKSDNFDTSAISSITIGDDDTSWYFNKLEVDNINLYTQPASVGNEKDYYLFPYFTGNNDSRTTYDSSQAMRFAVSDDCQTYTALNDNYPVINQTGSTTSYNARDPYILEGQDGYFYIIATDETYQNADWGKSAHRFVLWRSTDLVNWEEYDVDLYDLPNCNTNSNYINYSWAPQIIWDSDVNKYMIYFAFQDDTHTEAQCGTDKQELYYIYATDLFDVSTWEEPQLLFNAYALDGGACIDADITYIDGTYYMFYKSEGKGTIVLVKSDNLTGPYTNPIMLNHGYNYGATEGCQVWIDADGNIRYLADCYGLDLGFAVYNFGKNINALYAKGYYGTMTYKTNKSDFSVQGYMVDIADYYDSVSNASFNQFTPRHGSVLKITEQQYNYLLKADSAGLFNNAREDKSSSTLDIADNLILQYLVDDITTNTGTTSGSYNLSGTATWQNSAYMNKKGAAYFNASSLSANVGTAISNNASTETGLTISFYGKPDYASATKGRFFELANYGVAAGDWNALQADANYISMWNTTAGDSRGYMEFASGSYSNRDWNFGQLPYNLGGGWHLYTVTLVGTTVTLYVDGVAAKTLTTDKIDSTLYNGLTNVNLGGAIWSDDAKFTGWMRDFRVYNVGLTSSQVAKLPALYYADTYSGEANYSTLDAAIDAYEELIIGMSGSGYNGMLNNLAVGYEAYKDAIAAFNDGTAAEKESARVALNTAITNMTAFSEITGNHTPIYGSDSSGNPTPVESEYFSNVVYTDASASDNFYEEGFVKMKQRQVGLWVYGADAYIYYPNTVLLYDGKTTPTVPVVAGFINSEKLYSVNMLYLNNTTNAFSLMNNWWRGATNKSSLQWPETVYNETDCIPIDTTNTAEHTYAETLNEDYTDTRTTYRMYKNALELSSAPSSTYTCYSSTTWSMKSQYTYINTDHQISVSLNNVGPDIVIIDYSKLIDALKDASNNSINKSYLSDIRSKYSQGGLENLFRAYDSATSLNPNTGSTYYGHSYNYSGSAENMDEAALQCATDIDKSVNLLSNIKITTSDAKYERIVAAINAYEAKMNSMTNVYTNLESAYKAYLVAVEYADAYKYGNRTSEKDYTNPTLDECAVNLETATEAMHPFTELSWTGVAHFNSSNEAVNGGQNVLYCSTSVNKSSEMSKNYMNVYYYVPSNVVLVNDGVNTPYYPTALSVHTHGIGGTWTFFQYTEAYTSISCLTDNWRGFVDSNPGSTTFYYLDLDDPNISTTYTKASIDTNKNHQHYNEDPGYEMSYNANYPMFMGYHKCNTDRYYYNRLCYTGTTGDIDNYYEKATSATYNHKGYHDEWGNHEESDSKTINANLFVVNYKPLREKLVSISNNWTEEGINISDYQEGGLVDWFSKIDILTEIDPNQYDEASHPMGYNYTGGESYSGYSGLEGAVVHCADDIKGALIQTATMTETIPEGVEDTTTSGDVFDETTRELLPISENNGAYTNLKIALEEVKTAPSEQGCIKNTVWSDYNDAIADAEEAMYVIANQKSGSSEYGDKEGYTDNTVNALATALDTAIQNLYVLSNSEHPLLFSYEEYSTYDLYFQCCSNNAHILDGATHSTVIPASREAGQAYETLGMVYATLDRTKYSDLETIDNGKTVYDQVKTVPGAAGMSPTDIVDNGTRTLLNAINEANNGDQEQGTSPVSKQYTVTVNVYLINSDGTVSETPAGSAQEIVKTYGALTTVDVADSYWLPLLKAADSNIQDASDVKVARWSVDGKEIVHSNTSNTYNLFTTGNMTVNAYVLPGETAEGGQIVINNLSSNPLHTINVSDDSTAIVVDTSDQRNVVIGGKTYRVPSSLTYDIVGWVINGVEYKNGVNTTFGDVKNSEGGVTFRPIREANSSQKENGEYKTYTYTLDGEPIVENVKYDYRFNFTSNVENCYAIVFYNSDHDTYVPVAYGNSYELYANRSMDFYSLVQTTTTDPETQKVTKTYTVDLGDEGIKTITDKETLFYLNNKLPMVYSYSEITGDDWGSTVSEGVTTKYSNKWTTRTAFTTNVGGGDFGTVTVTECGTLRTTDSLNESTLVIENVGTLNISKKVNTERYLGSNQYSYSLSTTNKSDRTVRTRAYVKYQYTYAGETIDAIAYGPICTSYYGYHLS